VPVAAGTATGAPARRRRPAGGSAPDHLIRTSWVQRRRQRREEADQLDDEHQPAGKGDARRRGVEPCLIPGTRRKRRDSGVQEDHDESGGEQHEQRYDAGLGAAHEVVGG
jgi:hypothetical protein